MRITAVGASVMVWCFACNKATLPASEVQKAKALAEKHCASCHLNPPPHELDAESWKLVLDSMGEFLGIRRENSTVSLFENANLTRGLAPQISADDWTLLRKYFVAESAGRPTPRVASPENCSVEFQAVPVDYTKAHAIISWVEIDPACRCIRFSDASTGEMFEADLAGKIINRINLGFAVTSSASIQGKKYFVAAKNLLPNDEASGILFSIEKGRPVILQNDLIRPVYVSAKDQSLVVSEFGNLSGRLSLFREHGRAKRLTLSAKPGYLNTSTDKDGQILALRAQADEAIVRLRYKAREQDKDNEEVLMRFSPTWGSTSMEFFLSGRERDATLLTTHGDNGDLPTMPYKPQHGVRVFKNIKGSWTNTFFHAMPGAFKALNADFNSDGTPDIAAIAYFTVAGPKSSPPFELLMAEGEVYRACRIPAAQHGKWITMDVRDANQDGKPDILLGAAYTDQFKQGDVVRDANAAPNLVLLLGKKTR